MQQLQSQRQELHTCGFAVFLWRVWELAGEVGRDRGSWKRAELLVGGSSLTGKPLHQSLAGHQHLLGLGGLLSAALSDLAL